MTDHAPQDVAATFCATFVDELVRLGVTHAVICPGSRSTPMALALAADGRLAVSVHHDERAAGFVALGLAKVTGRPVPVLTTSGTATVELHPAVVEAHHAGVPVLALTADRPPELQGVGAPQTIDQRHLYGSAVRAFVDAGVPDWAERGSWRVVARGAVEAALGRAGEAAVVATRGPVQVNLPFREPLLGRVLDLPPAEPATGVVDAGRVPPAGGARLGRAVELLRAARRPVVLAGESGEPAARVLALAERLGAPVLADPRSGCAGPLVVAHADALVRAEGWASAHAPDLVVRVGDLPASKELGRWLERHPCPYVLVDPDGRRVDPRGEASVVLDLSCDDVLAVMAGAGAGAGDDGAAADHGAAVTDARESGWVDAWRTADDLAEQAIAATLRTGPWATTITEPAVARAVVQAVPDGAAVVVSSSMPVRDVEWFAPRRPDVTVLANRGANGIDGVTSTALGVALAGRRTVCLLGDLAFVHDSAALVALAGRPVDLTIVVVDNDGGGIFSFLAQADALDPARFEQLFGTPHGTDCAALARAHRLPVRVPPDTTELAEALRHDGPNVVVVRTDRTENVAVHRSLNAAVVAALDARPAGHEGGAGNDAGTVSPRVR